MIDHRVLYSLQDHLKTDTRDLDHHVFASAENTDTYINILFLWYIAQVSSILKVITIKDHKSSPPS
jgi:hypothetical protein